MRLGTLISTLWPLSLIAVAVFLGIVSDPVHAMILAVSIGVCMIDGVHSRMPPKEIARERSVPWQGVIDEYMKEEGDTLDFVIAMETWERMR
jgi:hypothetical protein